MKKNKLLERFMEFSSLVGNTNKVIESKDMSNLVKSKEYGYIHLNLTDEFNKEPIAEKEGIQNVLVEAELAIAETGTVVLTNSREAFRRATALAENLDVVFKLSNLVESLEDVADILKEHTENKCAYISFITGASRTADIEMILALGVHGPQTMNVFIIEDM